MDNKDFAYTFKLKCSVLEKNPRKEDLQLLVLEALDLCLKFAIKVETGRARSVETYKDCKAFIKSATKGIG